MDELSYIKKGWFTTKQGNKFPKIIVTGWSKNETDETINTGYTKQIFCPVCGAMSSCFDWGTNNRFSFSDIDDLYPCPSCGEKLSKDDYQETDTCNEHSAIYDYRCMKLTNYNIYENEDKIIASCFFKSYIPNTKVGKVGVNTYNFRIVFNTASGQTYILRIVDCKTKKSPYFVNCRKLINITYSDTAPYFCWPMAQAALYPGFLMDLSDAIADKVGNEYDKKEIHKRICDSINTNTDLINEYDWVLTRTWTLRNLIYYNKFHKLGAEFVDFVELVFKESGYGMRSHRRIKRELLAFSKVDKESYVPLLEKMCGIKLKKALKKEVIANPRYVYSINFLRKCGFKDINNILTLHDCDMFYNKNSRDKRWVLTSTADWYDNKDLFDFVKFLIKKKGENTVKKLFLDVNKKIDRGDFLDIAVMYKMYAEHDMLDDKFFKGTLIEMHNLMALNYDRIKTENDLIPYDSCEFDFEGHIDDYDFVLPKDTYELIVVGNAMGICVGSYGYSAKNKNCTIVVMKQKDSYVGCIELGCINTDDEKKIWNLRQAKAHHNNKIQESKAEALKKWVEEHKIVSSNCYDYKHIECGDISYDESQIYQENHNWAMNRQTYRQLTPIGEETPEDIDFMFA